MSLILAQNPSNPFRNEALAAADDHAVEFAFALFQKIENFRFGDVGLAFGIENQAGIVAIRAAAIAIADKYYTSQFPRIVNQGKFSHTAYIHGPNPEFWAKNAHGPLVL